MKCMICRQGELKPGSVTVTLERGESIVVVKGVPAEVCENCGEHWLSEEVTKELLTKAEEVAAKGKELELIRFAA